MTDWTTPAELTNQLMRLWDKGLILSAIVNGSTIFPVPLRLRRPDGQAMTGRFDEVRTWIRALEQGSKTTLGYGYAIGWAEKDLRQLGRNRIPVGIHVETEDDALRLLGKQRDALRFRRLVAETVSRFPTLRDWLAQTPLTAIAYSHEWDRILMVLEYCRESPRSGRYLRQLDIPGVDTKFIEDRKGILSVLLDSILPADMIDGSFAGSRNFEARYGLRCKPPLIRFRVLDSRLRLNGLSDITVPASEFRKLDLGVRRVFITENETNGIAFPDVPDSLVVFGLGYGVDLLAGCEWPGTTAVFYWGDIDTHGFAMLDRLRGLFPQARSLLMDRETLLGHRNLWVTEGSRYDKPLVRLTDAEQELYDDLRSDRLGEKVRLEQERIGFGCLQTALNALGG